MRRTAPRTLATTMVAAVIAVACTGTTPPPPVAPVLEAGDPEPERVEALIVLVGDAGTALPGRSPLLARVATDVERWSPLLAPEHTVVAYLGDLVYPWGVRPPGHPDHPTDTLHLHAQLEPLLGPAARRARAAGWFLDGNHDWGHLPEERGLARLRNGAEVVGRWAAAGHTVRFAPTPGGLGPEVVELGSSHRVLLMGTQAWLEASPEARREAAEALAEAATGTSRTVSVLAHHPLQSAGEHGDDPPVETGLGFQYLASQAGLIRQDMSSRPYRALISDVAAAMAARPALVWAGGHDHTLQLLRGPGGGMPRWTVVSGSASKVGLLGDSPEMVAGGAWPGYVRLFLLEDGSVQVQVVAARREAQHCRSAVPDDVAPCMEVGAAAFRTVVSRILRAPAP